MNRLQEFLFLLFVNGIGEFHKLKLQYALKFIDSLWKCYAVAVIFIVSIFVLLLLLCCINWVYQLIHVNLNYFSLSHEWIVCVNCITVVIHFSLKNWSCVCNCNWSNVSYCAQLIPYSSEIEIYARWKDFQLLLCYA